mmetsp:Transcript_60971/g.145291  ORF Transcript_60971/g.145291 Transcript_60971/m.145291 type:complete len:772 (-) Transcript_60971:141-2456(-)
MSISPASERPQRLKRVSFWAATAEGATSLKAVIADRVPQIQDAADFRLVRKLLAEELGGVEALRDELVFSGFLDPETNLLTLGERPFNVFAKIASGMIRQPGMEAEQLLLGEYQRRFVVCRNKADKDMHWDSEDPHWVKRASMARRHRFLTTRDLHWQWFNALTFGLIPQAEGGLDPAAVLREVETMAQAGMTYAKNAGWSKNIGLFVNVFGHNNVNSLFIHILDLEEVGPSFEAQQYKNLPLSSVLKVLKEEAGSTAAARLRWSDVPQSRKLVSPSRRTAPNGAEFFFEGKGGATSLKAEMIERLPVLRDAADLREARRLLREEFGGVHSLREELLRAGLVDSQTSMLTTGEQPFNLFARLGAGVMQQAGMDVEQDALGPWRDSFVVCCNRPENDVHWDSTDPEWVGRASMARRHRFLTTRKLHWQWFNPLCFGLVPHENGGSSVEEALHFMEAMRTAALTYTSSIGGWSDDVGLYFHIFGHNSVNSLHLHIVDLLETGPSFEKLRYKNCPLDQVIKVLAEEAYRYPALSQSLLPPQISTTIMAPSRSVSNERGQTTPLTSPSILHHRKASHTASEASVSILMSTKSVGEDVIELNVGGRNMDVSKKTLMQAPEGSLLRSMFEGDWDSVQLETDRHGRIYLDFPPEAFRYIIDHLRVRRLAQLANQEELAPPHIPAEHQCEVRFLAQVLGLEQMGILPDEFPLQSGSRSSSAATTRAITPIISRFPCFSGDCLGCARGVGLFLHPTSSSNNNNNINHASPEAVVMEPFSS